MSVAPGSHEAEDCSPGPAKSAHLEPMPVPTRSDCYGLLSARPLSRQPSTSSHRSDSPSPRSRRSFVLWEPDLSPPLPPHASYTSISPRENGPLDPIHSDRQRSSDSTACHLPSPSDPLPHVPSHRSSIGASSSRQPSKVDLESPDLKVSGVGGHGSPEPPGSYECRPSARSLPNRASSLGTSSHPVSPSSCPTDDFPNVQQSLGPPEPRRACAPGGCAEVLPVLLWMVLHSFVGVLLVGVLMGTTITTRAQGSLIWSLLSHQRAGVHTGCSAWRNATWCPAIGTDADTGGPGTAAAGASARGADTDTFTSDDAHWTPLHSRAGGSVAIGLWQPPCAVIYMALIVNLHALLFAKSWTWRSWGVSLALFLVRTVTVLVSWWLSDPLESDFMPLLGGMIVTMLLECVGHNAARPPAHRVMRSGAEVAMGLLALGLATFLPYGVWYVMGALLYGGVSVNSYLVLFASTFVFGCISVCQSLLFSRLPHFPIEACLLLRYGLEVGLLFPRRQYISSLDTSKEVVLASLMSSVGELGKGVVVAAYRRWRAQRMARAGRVAEAERQRALAVVDMVASVVGEQVSVWASFVGALVLDPVLFTTSGAPTQALTLGGALGVFLIQEAFEVVSDAGVLGAAFRLHRADRLPVGRLRRAPRFQWALVGTALTACGAMASVGFTVRWGCLSCLLRAQGYPCALDCMPFGG